MAAPYSDDLRDPVLAAFDRGMATKQIADIFQVSPAWARRVRQCRRETGRTRPLPTGGKRGRKIDRQRLSQFVAEQPDLTLKELREKLGIRERGTEKAGLGRPSRCVGVGCGEAARTTMRTASWSTPTARAVA